MYIKTIVIEGFKTYKDRVVIELDAGMNIIAGANGSGKSNIYEAIEFVLSEKFAGIRGDSRSKLLHEGAGKSVMSAYVELVFDNSDGRFPDDKKEISLKRTLGLKKDEYFLNSKHVTKQEVDNMLESAGLSRSNPYYIVRQGEVMKLIQMKASERLGLFKEIAGTRVYDERRKESTKIMNDTKRRYEDILEVIADLDTRLRDLQGERDELREYQTLDRERRCLEFNIYDHELRRFHRALEETDQRRAALSAKTADTHGAAMNVQDARALAEDQFAELSSAVARLSVERERTQAEARKSRQRRSQLEMRLSECEETATAMRTQRDALLAEQKKIAKEVADSEKLLEKQFRPQFAQQRQNEVELEEQLQRANARLNTLYSKQGRAAQYKSRAERDAALKQEVIQLEQLLQTERREHSSMQSDMQKARQDATRCQSDLERRETETQQARVSLDEARQNELALNQRRDQLNEQRRALWKEQQDVVKAVAEKKEQLRKAEGVLASTLSRSTSTGLAILNRLVAQHNIPGVYGPLIDLIQCDARYDKSVETVAGNRLFQIVVDSDDTVDRILQLMKRERQGRLTFMPLNRLVVEEHQYPNNSDQAIPLIMQIRHEERFRPAVMQVWGQTLLARSLAVATEIARRDGFDCITLDGDQVSKKGALTGGFIDARRSRMEAHKQIKALTAELDEITKRADSMQLEVEKLDQEITGIMGEVQKCTLQQSKFKAQISSAGQDLENYRRRHQVAASAAKKWEEQLERTERKLAEFEERVTALRDEMKQPLVDKLSADEQAELAQLAQDSTEMQKRLAIASQARGGIELEIRKLENQLGTNLRKRLDEIKSRLSSADDEDAEADVAKARQELKVAAQETDEIEGRLKDVEKEIEQKNSSIREIESERERVKTDEARSLHSLQEDMKEIERLMSRQSLLQQQRDDCQRKIRDLGSLPAEAHSEEYRNMSSKDLSARLTRNLRQLEKFKHVNRKAIDQYMMLNDKKAELMKKKEELDKGKKAIEDLIVNLDNKKDEAISRTYNGIGKHFSEVFAELVPGGLAVLKMMKKKVKVRPDGSIDEAAEAADEDEDDENENERKSSASSASAASAEEKTKLILYGIGISVSFTGSNQAFDMQQLSGGQKTVVALALIFAIQRCDPSPFYVFDEIDAALDPLYRTAVSTMLEEQKVSTQFIVTTFRPELLDAADRFLLVTFRAKISLVSEAEKDEVQRVLREVELEYEREQGGGAAAAASSSSVSSGRR